ncbi:MAG: ATP-dependent metallopeptidase FtsH/Yme1/Tma family protein, partial [Treponema sp.]|nr:ATP-dependent metallopeptidase FtsH/Yme1/Tma family protein [Treponema sp.]
MSDDQNNKNSSHPVLSGGKPNRFALFLFLAVVIIFVGYFFRANQGPAKPVIAYSEFSRSLEANEVSDVVIYENNVIEGSRVTNGIRQQFRTLIPYQDPQLLPTLQEKGISVTGAPAQVGAFGFLSSMLPWVLNIGFIWLLFVMLRNMQQSGNRNFQFGKSRAKRYHEEGRKIGFDDVAGQKDAKYELEEVVDFLKNPQKFTRMGAKIPKGVLLVGMPGTGKTLMAKAVAGEAGVAYFHMSGSDFVEMFVGVG